MTSMYDEPPQGDVVRLAGVIVARHRDGRCQTCRPDGCAELEWAQPVWAGWESRWMAAAVEAGR